MTELELYKYINDNNIEYHYADNNGVEDVLIFPMYSKMEEFTKMIDNYLVDNIIHAVIKNNYLCIWMNDICEAHGIEISKVFKKD